MFVAPGISEEEAGQLLKAGGGVFRFFRGKRSVFLKRIELLYIPFYLFELSIIHQERTQSVKLAVDGLLGHSVLFVGDGLVFEERSDGAVFNHEISFSQAREQALEEYRILLLEYGLKNRSFSGVEEISGKGKIYYPFWVGYFRKRGGYDFKALDAVSAEIQGIKMRRVFIRAFRQTGSRESEKEYFSGE